LRELVPGKLQSRFIFHGGQTRQQIPQYLARARIAVVPSRWENFPYACVEAMSSGLPVLATRQGGMPEMIRDGHTGWLTDQPTSEQLAQTLRRALETPPDVMAEMGRQASEAIEQICSPELVLEKQIEFRTRIALHPPTRSRSVPVPFGHPDGQVNRGKSRPQKSGLKLIDVFKLARKNPGFFFGKAVWAITQLRKKLQAQEK